MSLKGHKVLGRGHKHRFMGAGVECVKMLYWDIFNLSHWQSGSWKLLILWKNCCFLHTCQYCSKRFCMEILYPFAKTNPVLSIIPTEMPTWVVECTQFLYNQMYPCGPIQNQSFLEIKKGMFFLEIFQSKDIILILNLGKGIKLPKLSNRFEKNTIFHFLIHLPFCVERHMFI